MPGWQQPQRPIRVPCPGSRPRSGSTPTGRPRTSWSSGTRRCRLPDRRAPGGTASDEHRTVVSRLATAKQRLTVGTPDDIKASVAASRKAVELFRKMRPASVITATAERDLAEREAVILDKTAELAQALFSYDSPATHTDPHLRDIAWRRESAVLALGAAASFAQLIFARTGPPGSTGTTSHPPHWVSDPAGEG